MLIETLYKDPIQVKVGDIMLTHSGQQAHIVAVNPAAKMEDQCIFGFVNGHLRSWCLNGDFCGNRITSAYDLQMPEADLEVRTVTSCIVIRENGDRILVNDINAEQARELVDDAVMTHCIEYVVPANQD